MKTFAVTFANALTLAFGGLAYLSFSKALTPLEFSVYGLCLAAARLGVAFLDSGGKVHLVKLPQRAFDLASGGTFWLMTGNACLLSALSWAIANWGVVMGRWDRAPSTIVVVYLCSYLLTYPFIVYPLASLERSLNFNRIASFEAAANAMELLLPVPLYLLTELGLWSFPLGAWAGRLVRVCGVARFMSIRLPRRVDYARALEMFSGTKFYIISLACNVVRDNLHFLLIGPVFGQGWMGLYAWSTMLGGMMSQLFVAAFARVSIPHFAAAGSVVARTELLSTQLVRMCVSLPPAALVLFIVVPIVDQLAFKGKWAVAAEELLPFVLIRVLSAAFSTSFGAVVLASTPARNYAYAMTVWTALEAAITVVAVRYGSPVTPIIAYALCGWLGALVTVYFSRASVNFQEVGKNIILSRPLIATWTLCLLSLVWALFRENM